MITKRGWFGEGIEDDVTKESSGFSALPGGYRDTSGYIYGNHRTGEANRWTSTESGSDRAYGRHMSFSDDEKTRTGTRTGTRMRRAANKGYAKKLGFSVRCVKDGK